MPLLDRITKKPAASAKKLTAKKVLVTETAIAKKVDVATMRLLTKPYVSEKAARLADRGTYVFVVPMDSEKISIRKAVEACYKVNVEAVRIVRVSGKPVRRGKRVTFRKDVKKALVTLKKGQTLSLYEGV